MTKGAGNAGGKRQLQAWQPAPSSSYSPGNTLTLDQHGMRQRLNSAYAKVMSAGRTATSAAAALASAAVFARSLEDRPHPELDAVLSLESPRSDACDDDLRQASLSQKGRRKRAKDKQRRCQSVPLRSLMEEQQATVDAAATWPSTKQSQGKSSAWKSKSGVSNLVQTLPPQKSLSKPGPGSINLQLTSERSDTIRPDTACRTLSPWSDLSAEHETSLRQALAAQAPEAHRPDVSMPPMKKWLQEKITKIDQRHTEQGARYQSSGELASKVLKSESEIYTEHFLRQQFPVSLLRGDDEWQRFREEDKNHHAQLKLEKERSARKSQRASMKSMRLSQQRQDEGQKEEDVRQNSKTDGTGDLNASVSPRQSLWDMDPDLAQKTQKWLKILKPKNNLSNRLEMLERMSKNGRKQSTRGSEVKGWGVVKMLISDKEETVTFSLLDSLPLAEQEMLKETFLRYAPNISLAIKSSQQIRNALKDVGLFPKTTQEKHGIATALKCVTEDKTGQTFEEFAVLTRNVREVIMEVQRSQLEDLHHKFSDSKGVIDSRNLPVICKEFGISIEEIWDVKEVEKHFSTIINAHSDKDALQNFEEFAKLFQLMQEKLFAHRRKYERDIADQMGVSDGLLQEFRNELPALHKQFTHYDKDNSGHLEQNEILGVLADRGVLPKTKQQIREVEQIISESKRGFIPPRASQAQQHITIPVSNSSDSSNSSDADLRPSVVSFTKSPLDRIPERENLGVQFNFSEFLLLIKRVRKLNSEIQDNELAIVFNRYDTDRSGELEMREVSILLSDVGLQPRNREDQDGIMLILQEVDEDGSNSFSLDEFKVLVSRIRERKEQSSRERQMAYAELLGHSVDQYKELLRIFFELDQGSIGALGPTDIKRLLSRCRKKFTEKDFQRLFSETDKDTSGFLEFPEFLQLMAMLDKGGNVPAFDQLDCKKEK